MIDALLWLLKWVCRALECCTLPVSFLVLTLALWLGLLSDWAAKILRQRNCDHDFAFLYNFHGDAILHTGKRSVWSCCRCRLLRWRNEPGPEVQP